MIGTSSHDHFERTAMPRPCLPPLVEEDFISLTQATTATVTLATLVDKLVVATDTGRVQVDSRYFFTDQTGRLSCTVTLDGQRVRTPARWSSVVALVHDADALVPEHIRADEQLHAEVSGDHGETWEPYRCGAAGEAGLVDGKTARAFIAGKLDQEDGCLEHAPGRLTVHLRLFNGHLSRHAFRFTRSSSAQA